MNQVKVWPMVEVILLLRQAQAVGLYLGKGSLVEGMTIAQLDALLNGKDKCDA